MIQSRSGTVFSWLVFALLAASAFPFALSGTALAQGASQPSHPGAIEQGRHLFNSQCAHCHGEDASTDDDYYNLPQLMIDKDDAFFFATVNKGLPEKGMPPWKDVLKPRQIVDLLVYIRSLEREQGLIDNQEPAH
jgi:polar amino acid transport system substrate-binding protein